MLVTQENIKNLKLHQKVWIAYENKPITKTRYLGLIPNDFDNKYHCFGQPFTNELINIYFNNDFNKQIFTTYEEACKRQREMFCNLINHYNTHQFKNDPIIVI